MNPAQLDPEQLKLLAQAKIQEQKRAGTWAGSVRPHTEYQTRPVAWMVDKLGIPEHTIRWSLNPGYQNCVCNTTVCNPEKRNGGPHIWDGVKDPLVVALEALGRGENVAVPSGTGCQKTYTLAAAGALWFLACFERSIVISIAQKEDQLLLNMWKEIGKLLGAFKRHFPSATFLTGKLRMLDEEGGQEVWAASAVTAGVDADEAISQRLKGLHGADMLWIVEEFPGMNPANVKTIINTATGSHNPIMGLGNPESLFDELAMFGKRSSVREIRISAWDHPNIVTGVDVIPGAVSPKSVAERLEDALGDTADPMFMAQVRGIAPEQAAEAVIKREWCEAAAARYNDPAFRVGPLSLGVDPSNSETSGRAAIARGQGACLTEVERRVCADALELGKEIYAECMEYKIDPQHVGVDSIGYGSSTVNKCRALGFYVRAMNGSTRPEVRIDEALRYGPLTADSDPNEPPGPVVLPSDTYYHARDQWFFRLREDLRLGLIALPNDPELFEELCIWTWMPKNGKKKVLEKEVVMKKLRRSPDKSDSTMYWNWCRPRRGGPRPEAPAARPNAHFDEHFDKMMAERSVETVGAVSRRPF